MKETKKGRWNSKEVRRNSNDLQRIKWWKRWGEIFLNVLFPKYCVVCQTYETDGVYICAVCSERILFCEEGVQNEIKTIGNINDDNEEESELNSKDKANENNAKRKIFLDGYEAVGWYVSPLRELIKEMKYKNIEGIGRMLGEWLSWWAKIPWEIDLICHVPLHVERFKERGFNQARLMAVSFAKRSQRQHSPILERKQYRINQASLDAEARMAEIAGVFAVRTEYLKIVEGKRILVIDDVVTTGSTFNDCARALKEAGAKRVYGLAMAKG